MTRLTIAPGDVAAHFLTLLDEAAESFCFRTKLCKNSRARNREVDVARSNNQRCSKRT